jgi:hypothetical protein
MNFQAPPKEEKLPGGYKRVNYQRFSPEQMDVYRQLYQYIQPGSFLNRLIEGGEEVFAEEEAPALRQFGALQQNLASRFAGMGQGALQSSGFRNEANQAISDFAQQLQSQRRGIQREALSDLLGLSSNLLQQQPYGSYMIPQKKKRSFLQKLLGGAAPIAGAAIGGALGGPSGAGLGFQAGSGFSQALMG